MFINLHNPDILEFNYVGSCYTELLSRIIYLFESTNLD